MKKSGGAYLTVQEKVRKIDEYAHQVLMKDGPTLTVEYIVDIEGDMFRMYANLEVQS